VTDEAPLEPASVDVVTEDSPEAKRRKRRRSTRSWIIEWGAIIVVAILVAFVVRTYVVQTFYIPSGSMEPTLQVGDRILVSKLSTEFGSVHIGDILVFKRPPKENCGGAPVPFLVKRVIGLPGDHLTSKGNTIYVNGKVLHQTWSYYNPVSPAIGNVVVPKNTYFMMGDNHGDSCDSRYWGPLPANLVVGKAVLRIWPLSRFGTL
jgi:signal peptidase I